MLLSGYTWEACRSDCNHRTESVYCVARLDDDISAALPYLNAVYNGYEFFADPPLVLFVHEGRPVRAGAKELAVAGLADSEEAERVLARLKEEINSVWERRGTLTPRYAGREKPQLLSVLKLLPKTNCRQCGRASCMAFAAQVREGERKAADCPDLAPEARRELEDFLAGFGL